MPKTDLPWTAESKQTVTGLALQGIPIIQIARLTGINFPRITRLLRESGIAQPARQLPARTWTTERDADVARRYRAGQNMYQIAEQFGTTATRVMHSLRRSRVPSRPKIVFGHGENNPAWSGGRQIDKNGYILIRDPTHPNARKNGYIPEHRMVMAEALGRPLKPAEVVHHKKTKQDNTQGDLTVYESNADHLREELMGKRPNWTDDGKRRILAAIPRKRPFGIDS